MSISIVQSNKGFIANSAGPLPVAFSSNNTSGNLLVASFFANQLSGVSDSQGNTWTQLFASSYTVSGETQYIYYCLSCKPGANTVTLTFTGAGSYCGLVILEANAGGGTWSVDGTPTGASGSGTSFSSGSMTTTGTNDLLVSGQYNSSGLTVTPGTGWTTLQTGTNFNDTLQYQIVTSAGAQTSTASTATSAAAYMLDIGAFVASGGGGNQNVASAGTIGVTGVTNVQLAAEPPIVGNIGVTGQVAVAFGLAPTGNIGVTGAVQTVLQAPQNPTGLIGVTGQVFVVLAPSAIAVSGTIGVTGVVFIVLGGGPSPPPPNPPTPIPVPQTGVHGIGLIDRFDVVINSILRTNPNAIVREASTGNLYFLRRILNRILVSPQDPRANPGLRFAQTEYLPDQGTISWVTPTGTRLLLYTILSGVEWNNPGWIP